MRQDCIRTTQIFVHLIENLKQVKKQVYFFILPAFILFACHRINRTGLIGNQADPDTLDSIYYSEEDDSEDTNNEPTLDDLLIHKTVDSSQLFKVTGDVAVFLQLSEQELDSMKLEDEEDFETTTDDMGYFSSDAVLILRKYGIPDLRTTRHYVSYQQGTDTFLINARKDDIAGWYLLLFCKENKPLLVQTIDLSEEIVKNYFNK